MTPLESLNKRAATVRDMVRSVARGYTHAAFIYGPGGHGKTHAVVTELNEYPGPGKWVHHNSHCTPAALRDALALDRDKIHVFDDMESLYKDNTAAGLLRSACSSAKGQPRLVTYETAKETVRFHFSGGVIIVSNESLKNNGVLGAIASRFRPIEWKLSRDEIAALITESAKGGAIVGDWQLRPAECRPVAEWLVAELRAGNPSIDLRTWFDHAIPLILQSRAGHLSQPWQDVLQAKLVGEVKPERLSERMDRQREIAVECFRCGRNINERLKLWQEATGKGKNAYYRVLNVAKANGMLTARAG